VAHDPRLVADESVQETGPGRSGVERIKATWTARRDALVVIGRSEDTLGSRARLNDEGIPSRSDQDIVQRTRGPQTTRSARHAGDIAMEAIDRLPTTAKATTAAIVDVMGARRCDRPHAGIAAALNVIIITERTFDIDTGNGSRARFQPGRADRGGSTRPRTRCTRASLAVRPARLH